jgi:hypothetical protein
MNSTFRCAAFFATLLSSAPAYGQAAPANGSARTHFNEGLAYAARGELPVALQEFEAAYALKPHYSVLYNIGQAHAALGHPVEAVRAFERHLLEGGNRISQARRDQVRDLIASNRARVGELRLVGLGETTRVWVDGVEVERSALSEPLLVVAGKHAILSSHGSGFPASQTAMVAAATATELSLPAAPASTAEVAPPLVPAKLRVVCDLPGVTVDIGETTRGTTPMPGLLPVQAGILTVRFSRAGYRPVTHQIVASPQRPVVATCDQVVERELAPATKATLVVRTVPFDADIFVDGERFLGAALPYGPHELKVERHGFVTQRKAISLRPRDVTTYQVTLAATPARQAERASSKSHRKFLGYTTGAGGLALAITGAALLGWNSGRYDDWRREHTTASPGAQLQTVTSIQRVDDIAVGCTALGAGLIATGAWLLLSGPTENP